MPRDQFDLGVGELRRLGFEPVYDEPQAAGAPAYLAGSAEVRAAAFLKYWTDPAVAAVVAARGGYGSVHLLPLIGSALGRATPKVFVGFSDTTSILSWLTCHCAVPALHGPMLDGRLARGPSAYDEASLVAFLTGGAGVELAPDGLAVLRAGEAAGPCHGGTLTQLCASLGTPYAFDPPRGCVLFIEDVNERPYRLDRLLTQLRLAGVLSRAAAIVFGEMAGCDEPGGTPSARDVLRAFAEECSGPVLAGFPSGHTTGPTWTLPLGVEVRVTSRPRPAVIVEEAPVG